MDTTEKIEALKSAYADEGELNDVLTKLLDLALGQQRARLARYEQALEAFEERYSMASEAFYRRFKAGELGDAMDYFEWSGLYELKLDLVNRIRRLEGAS